jgi:hypothetical protein
MDITNRLPKAYGLTRGENPEVRRIIPGRHSRWCRIPTGSFDMKQGKDVVGVAILWKTFLPL